MSNEEYYEALEDRLQQLKESRELAKSIANGIIGKTLCTEDLYFSSALDRSIALLDGIVDMAAEADLPDKQKFISVMLHPDREV